MKREYKVNIVVSVISMLFVVLILIIAMFFGTIKLKIVFKKLVEKRVRKDINQKQGFLGLFVSMKV